MMQQTEASPKAISDRLAAALAKQAIPKRFLPQAERVLDVLSTPRKVTLMTAPGAGARPAADKSRVLNLLMSANVLPVGHDFGTVQLNYGPAERTHLTLADGSKLSHEGLPDPGKLPGPVPVLTEIEAPLPALQRISVTDLAIAASGAAQQKAIRWAAARTEIAIWCTATFEWAELALWQSVPDVIKDHALLVSTEYTALGQNRDRATALLKENAGDEFASVMAISAAEAWEARAGDVVDMEAMKRSGGTQLVSVLLRQIAAIEQHAMDRAEMCFAAAGIDLKPSVMLTVVEPPAAAPEVEPAAEISPETTKTALNEALSQLQGLGARFAGAADGLDEKGMLKACAETLDWLDLHFADLSTAPNPALRRLTRMVQDGTDIVQLLQMEADRSAGKEAISIMVQLKRGIQAALAA